MNTDLANRIFRYSCLLCCLFVAVADAQTDKKNVTLRDVSLWRRHAVTLSDGGDWYAIRYNLSTTEKIEDPKPSKKSGSEDKEKEKEASKKQGEKKDQKEGEATKKELEDIATYGQDAMTDVLYIRSASGDQEHEIKRGTRPVFSKNSEWVAYSIAPEKSKKPAKRSSAEKGKNSKQAAPKPVVIELLHLESGDVKRWEIASSNAGRAFQFPKYTNYFAVHSKSGLLLFDLDDRNEHYIGNVGEFRFNKNVSQLIYTIETDDRNGNGIYAYNWENGTTRALHLANEKFSALSLSEEHDALAAYQIEASSDPKKPGKVQLVVVTELDSDQPVVETQSTDEWNGMPEGMKVSARGLAWSQDNDRLFISIAEDTPDKEDEAEKVQATPDQKTADAKTAESSTEDEPESADAEPRIVAKSTVDVWHWKDETLQSQQRMEEQRGRQKSYDAVLDIADQTVAQLTQDDFQLQKAEGHRWGIGSDRKPYISDWDVSHADIYRVDLETGERKSMIKRFNGRVQISPDGKQALYWRDGHYWIYAFDEDTHRNITNSTAVSFINREHDHFGSEPAYGVEGMVKGGEAVILKHRHDLWLQPLDGKPATCLTLGKGEEKQIRFSLGLPPNLRDPDLELEDKYVDLDSPLMLRGVGSRSKNAGYFLLDGGDIETVVYEPVNMGALRKAKDADVVVYTQGDYQNFLSLSCVI